MPLHTDDYDYDTLTERELAILRADCHRKKGKAREKQITEKSIVIETRAAINKIPKTRCFKYYGGSSSVVGHADLYGASHGIAFFLEMKRVGEKPSKVQTAWLEDMAKTDAIVGWATSKDQAVTILREGLLKRGIRL